jgi:radical SAM-linked protein
VRNRLSLPCGKAAGMFVHHTNLEDAEADQRKLVCYDCGIACDLTAMRRERLVSLSKLGARTKREPRPPSQLPVRGAVRRLPFKEGEAVRRYRFQYTKLGPSALLSHLDLIRALPRALRRLDVPLKYTVGFHPKPDMSFGPALSLGVFSLCEFVDVKITADLEPGDLLGALTAGSHEGLRFVAAAQLGDNDAAVSRVVDTARYVVAVPRSVLAPLGGVAWLEERVAQARAAGELPIVRRIDGIGKRVDVKKFLLGVDVVAAPTVLAEAGLAGDLVTLRVDCAILGSGAVKIAEVVEALAHDASFEHRAVRVAMGRRRGSDIVSPLHLDDLRGRPLEAATPVAAAALE